MVIFYEKRYKIAKMNNMKKIIFRILGILPYSFCNVVLIDSSLFTFILGFFFRNSLLIYWNIDDMAYIHKMKKSNKKYTIKNLII